ncbi:hypothetical protein [Dyadobacter luticola]|uniref:Uncharacterized protein n=1 Tax=Dyadobacter luticola TaxID=1979387 RepID=A0A5R9KP79_9BACT|nr:hypothetical protein [Dyadobacter luticola]TLU98023.1 hypothetical protein FEN17_24865 [Dyadobacter luticola]
MNYTHEESGSFRAYDYTVEYRGGDKEYLFQTESGAHYSCYFANASAYFEDYPLVKDDIVTFGLKRTSQSKGFFVDKYDARIKATVFQILCHVIEMYPERSMLVMYDTSDGRQRNRKITFARWYNECSRLLKKKVTRISISGSSIWSGEKFDMMLLVPNTCSKLEQIKLSAFEIRDELISKGYPPTLECRIECK